MRLRRLLRSPTVLSVVVHGAAGAGFAGANIVLARLLPEREYALFTLVVALMNLGHALAPCGIDGLVLRRELIPSAHLLRRVLAATSVVGLALAGVGLLGYELAPGYAVMVFLATAAGGAMYVAAARFQREHRFAPSLTLFQSPNLVLIVAALAVLLLHGTTARVPLVIATTGFGVAALWGWGVLLRERRGAEVAWSGFPWRETLAIMGLNASGLLLVQLDRLIIPYLLPLEALAVYGVLAAIVGSLFRVLQMGVAFSLTPRLARAPDVRARRRLLAAEARLVALAVVLGSVAIWVVTPWIERLLLAGKYHLPGSLILAAIAAGVAKSLNAFSTAAVTVLTDERELSRVNLLGWGSVALSVVAAALLARWGLAGVVYGVGLGWLVRALAGLAVVMRHLREPDPAGPVGEAV